MGMRAIVSHVFSDCGPLCVDGFLTGCWVRREFRALQLVTEYVWLWVSLILMAILYTIMFVVMRGWFVVDNGVWYWYKNYIPRHGAGQPLEETQEEKESKAIANML